jgi:hypothetical protein
MFATVLEDLCGVFRVKTTGGGMMESFYMGDKAIQTEAGRPNPLLKAMAFCVCLAVAGLLLTCLVSWFFKLAGSVLG